MSFSEETLMAYADNELDAQTRAAVEAAMATDPEVARRVAQHKKLRGQLGAAFGKTLDEPTPQRLIDAARGAPTVRREGNVIPLRRKNTPQRAWPQWASMAASLVVGVLIGQAILRNSGGTGGPVTSRNGQLVANGDLAHALTEQLASTQTDQTPVRIGVSFNSKAGDYCRTFTVHDTTALAGLACRDHDDWHVRVLAQTKQTPTTSDGNTTYRQAASEIPKSVMDAIEETIAGDPLDTHAEAAAREENWISR